MSWVQIQPSATPNGERAPAERDQHELARISQPIADSEAT